MTAYLPVIVAAILVSVALATHGSFIIQKNQSSWILAVSQICINGHLLAKLFLTHEHGVLEFIFAVLFYFIGLYLVKKLKLSDSSLLGLFVVFMAINYQLIALFPVLDSHLASSLFGDIATLSNSSALVLTLFAFIYLIGHTLLYKLRIKALLLKTYYRDQFKTPPTLLIFNLLAHLFLILSLFELGFLFVLSFLLLPTQLLKGTSSSLKQLLILGAALSVLSSGSGLLLSLSWTRLSTMPTQICLLVFIGFVFRQFNRKSK